MDYGAHTFGNNGLLWAVSRPFIAMAKMLIERYLPLWLCLISLLAFKSVSWFGVDLFSWSSPYLLYVVAITMFAIGWLLPAKEVHQVFRRWPTVIGGTLVQYTSMPLLAFTIGRLFRLDDDAMTGIVICGCVPGAMASNVLTLVARGNVSYSVSLTTMATILSPLMVPLALFLSLGKQGGQDPLSVSITLSWSVVAPTVIGHLLSRRYSGNRKRTNKIAIATANFAILLIIACVVAKNHERLSSTSLILIGALLSLNLSGYLSGFLAASAMRVPDGMRRALTLEVGMQNAGVGTALATSIFADRPAVMIPTAIYTFGCMLTGTILAKLWALRNDGPATRSSE